MSDLRVENTAGGQKMLQGECSEIMLQKEVGSVRVFLVSQCWKNENDGAIQEKAVSAAAGFCPQLLLLNEPWEVKRMQKAKEHYFSNERQNVGVFFLILYFYLTFICQTSYFYCSPRSFSGVLLL